MRLDDEKMLVADVASRLLVTMSNWSDQERATQIAVSRAVALIAEVDRRVDVDREASK